jgi:hypothetical protein
LIGADDFLGQLQLDVAAAVAKGIGKVTTEECDLQPRGSGAQHAGSVLNALKASLGGAKRLSLDAKKTAPDAYAPEATTQVDGYVSVATRGKIKLSFALHTRAKLTKTPSMRSKLSL